MSQSNVIAGALVIAFIIFITVRGELDDYLSLFTKKRVVGNTNSKPNGKGKGGISDIVKFGDSLNWGDISSYLDGSNTDASSIPDGTSVEI